MTPGGEQAPSADELELFALRNANRALEQQLAESNEKLAGAERQLAFVYQLPELPWAEVSASIMQRLSMLAREGDKATAKQLLDVLDKGKTYVARLQAQRDEAKSEAACLRAARVKWPDHVLAAIRAGDVEACAADAAKRHANWTALEREVAELRAECTRLSLAAANDQTRDDLAAMTAERDDLQARLNGADQRANAYLRERDEARDQVQALQLKADLLDEEVKRVTESATVAYERLEAERDEAEEALEDLGQVCCGVAFTTGQYEDHNERMLREAVCAYCGEPGPRTPEAMTAHASVCAKHPLATALARVGVLREVLQRTEPALRPHGQQEWDGCDACDAAAMTKRALADPDKAAAERDERLCEETRQNERQMWSEHLAELALWRREFGLLAGEDVDHASISGRVERLKAEATEEAAKHIENHSCVSSCCDAQPGGIEAKALADCVRNHGLRALAKPPSEAKMEAELNRVARAAQNEEPMHITAGRPPSEAKTTGKHDMMLCHREPCPDCAALNEPTVDEHVPERDRPISRELVQAALVALGEENRGGPGRARALLTEALA